MTYNNSIPYDIQMLEKEPMTTTNEFNDYDENAEISLRYVNNFLYHGIRFQRYLEKLENIFKTKKILAGKYNDGYYPYEDNCNMGEYVSLLKWLGSDSIEYDTFINSNISLIVNPYCNAIETKYVNYETWDKIKNQKLKNIYSYMRGECLCKDFIPLDMVKAIGIPYRKWKSEGKIEYTDRLLDDISNLMKQYDIKIPIVDTSHYNRILVEFNQNNKKRK